MTYFVRQLKTHDAPPAAADGLVSSTPSAAGIFAAPAPLWRLARELRARPVAIDPRAWASIDAQLSAAIAARAADAPRLVADGGRDRLRVRDDGPRYALTPDGLAVVALRGVCGRHLSQMDTDCGGCDVDRVRDDLLAADADRAARAILLDVDSPGGSVAGVAECARIVRDLSTPVVAYAADECASAAYWIASQADAIVAGPTADIGSVGVYCALLDESVRYDRAGVRVEMIASGANKGAGYPGTTLTDGQRAVLQSQVDFVADLFRGAVLAHRADITADMLDGRCLVGAQAVDAGFADRVGDAASAGALALALADALENQE